MYIKNNLIFKKINNIFELVYIYNIIKDLDNFYPNFYEWYYRKFIPDVLLNKDIALILKNKYNEIIGVSLMKNQKEEKKLRCIRITPKYQNKGYGLFLIDKSLKIIDEPLPLCTVAEELIDTYSRILVNRYGFKLTYVEKNLYRKNKLEYIFNQKVMI